MEEHEEGAARESSERWLVSYADFITMLFALFVLLYALSMQTKEHASRSMEAVAVALGAPSAGGIRPELDESSRARVESSAAAQHQLNQTMRQLEATVEKFPNSGISVKRDSRGIVISLSAAKFFDSGEAEIAIAQLSALDAVMEALSRLPNHIEIDGFTDSVPIANARFHDNWELSAARSASVLRYVLAHSALNPDHLTIAGYGPYRSIGDNSSEEGRALNRRVEIVIRPLGAN
jgi:chemotaxis protein MotB